jgi:nicotinate-nucleotide pyrophosphorylase (carboxylating)
MSLAVPPLDVAAAVSRALREDLGAGDLTAALIADSTQAVGRVLVREHAVLCGRAWFDETFRQLDQRVTVSWQAADGDAVAADTIVCELRGPARSIVTGERTALNFLQTLSGTATAARRHARLLEGLSCKVLDTRKTLPGLRRAQKYAVRCGGGANHRLGLYDGILVKENHIVAAGSIAAAVAAARAGDADVPIEVECESLEELRQALAAGADMALLDEFPLEELRAAVALNRAHVRPIRLEASGNVSLETLRSIAETGVDFVSVGALTKHLRAVDLSMRLLVAA